MLRAVFWSSSLYICTLMKPASLGKTILPMWKPGQRCAWRAKQRDVHCGLATSLVEELNGSKPQK